MSDFNMGTIVGGTIAIISMLIGYWVYGVMSH